VIAIGWIVEPAFLVDDPDAGFMGADGDSDDERTIALSTRLFSTCASSPQNSDQNFWAATSNSSCLVDVANVAAVCVASV
jgi:hypothetical protein